MFTNLDTPDQGRNGWPVESLVTKILHTALKPGFVEFFINSMNMSMSHFVFFAIVKVVVVVDR